MARAFKTAGAGTSLDCASLNRLARSPELTWLWNDWLGESDALLRYQAEPGSAPRLSARVDGATSVQLEHPLARIAS